MGGGAKKPKPKPQQQKPKVEDVTHVKAQEKNANLRFDEVQDNMKSQLEKSKDQWCTPDLLEKIMKSPRLSAAFSDPATMKVLQDMGSDPQGTMQKYGNNPEFKELLMEFSALMGGHLEQVGKKEEEEKKKEEEKRQQEIERQKKEMENDPVMKKINTDTQVKALLEDPKV